MPLTRRLFISAPRDHYLDARRSKLKRAIVAEIEARGYQPQIFGSAEGGRGDLIGGRTWSPAEAEKVMRRCVGAAVIGLPVWSCSGQTGVSALVTEYCHYEGALARTLGLPILALLEEGAQPRGIFNPYGGAAILTIPQAATAAWARSKAFQSFLNAWHERLHQRWDVFLGYSSSSAPTAGVIREFLENDLQVRVRDWHDFPPAGSILDAIESAEAECTAGVFLFTADDKLEGSPSVDIAVPRDNVVFEAGYFARGKGKDRVLIIRQRSAKMPADLGGDIYVPFSDERDFPAVKEQVARFIAARL